MRVLFRERASKERLASAGTTPAAGNAGIGSGLTNEHPWPGVPIRGVGRRDTLRSTDLSKLIRTPLFRAGIALQCLSAALIGLTLLAIRLEWIDIVSIGLERGIDEPSPTLEALHWGLLGLTLAFAAGFALYAVAFHRQGSAQGAPPNGGPARPAGHSGVAEGSSTLS